MHSILSTRGLRGHLSDAIPLTGSLLIGCTTAPRASGPPVRPLDPGITSFTRVNPFVFSDLLANDVLTEPSYTAYTTGCTVKLVCLAPWLGTSMGLEHQQRLALA